MTTATNLPSSGVNDAAPFSPSYYVIIDRHTGLRVAGPFSTMRRAQNKADKLDLAYGAVRYSVQLQLTA